MLLLLDQFLSRAAEDFAPVTSGPDLVTSVKFSLTDATISRLNAMADIQGVTPEVMADRLIRRATTPPSFAHPRRTQLVLREGQRLRELTRLGGWSCQSALLTQLVSDAVQTSSAPVSHGAPPPHQDSRGIAPIALVATFVSEVYAPTWDPHTKHTQHLSLIHI